MRDVIEMAREAGICTWLKPPEDVTERLERFANLVRAEALAQDKPYRLLQDNGSKYFGPSWDKADQALNRMADNARELGLDYEPDGMHHNKPQKRPQNCGTGYCSCIECVMEPAQRTWVGLTNNELQPIADEYRILFGSWVEDFARAIEAKLRSKNT